MTGGERYTPYPEVNAVLALLLDGVRGVLGPALVGLYLYGSLSSGDFDPEGSDIDFLVVTERDVPAPMLPALEALHARIAATGLPWARRLEGSYIPRRALRRYDPADTLHPTIGLDWPFGVARHGYDWVIQRAIVREQGVTVHGPPPDTLIEPVGPDDLRHAAARMGVDFWSHQLAGPEWLRTREYQAFAILTMCRILYTLERGAVASKPGAAAWARGALGERWAPLIDIALRWRHDTTPDDMGAMLDFISATVERCRAYLGAG